jgi:hypothetical protein
MNLPFDNQSPLFAITSPRTLACDYTNRIGSASTLVFGLATNKEDCGMVALEAGSLGAFSTGAWFPALSLQFDDV